MNPITLVLFALQDATAWVIIGVCALAVVVAFAVFGGGWS